VLPAPLRTLPDGEDELACSNREIELR
jgi:hypothetical protein